MNSTLKSLAESRGFPLVSIYFPTHPTFPDAEQDPIRLANALSEVSSQLVEAGWGPRDIEDFTAEAASREKGDHFWRYQDRGLAVFIEEGKTQWVKLPAEPEELVVVAGRYHLRPLIHMMRDRGHFHVLAASEGSVHFYTGSNNELLEIHVAEMPSSVEQLRGRTDFDADVIFHNRDRGSQVGGAQASKYSALGQSPEDYEQILIDHYARDIANAVDAHLAAGAAPLILVALPRMLGRLKHHLDYAHLIDDAVALDPNSMDVNALHAAAWQLANPALSTEREELRDRLRAALKGAGAKYSTSLEDIMRAAEEGRVDTVFLANGVQIWGHYDPQHRIVRIDYTSGPENEDLLNLLALRVLEQGGDARSLPEDMVDEIGPVAALYRY